MKIVRFSWILVALLIVSSSCRLINGKPKGITEIQCYIYPPIRVDSEFGELNGVFSPEIIYYTSMLQTGNADLDNTKLLVTTETLVYYQKENEIQRVPLNFLNKASKVKVVVGDIDRRDIYPQATALKNFILETR